MSLSQKGARYENQAQIERDHPVIGKGMSHLASMVRSLLIQGNFGERGEAPIPTPPTQISVSATGSLFTVRITHNNAPAGCRYWLQYARVGTFANQIDQDLGESTSWEKYVPGATLYFRAATKNLASKLSPWVYFGPSNAPISVT